MRLAATRYGEAGGTPLVIAHGLFGSGRNWGVLAKRLSADRPVIAVDMRNHGESPRSDDHGYPAMAADLAETIAAEGGAADLLGHSMGGKAAMTLALSRPEAVRRLVVADIAPVAYDHSQAHLIDALQAVDLSRVRRRADADAQLAAHIETEAVRAFLLQSLDLTGPRWQLNLRALEAEMEHILGWPEPAGRFEGPTLFLSGALSDYLRPEARPGIREQFPAATFEVVAGAGHWLHAERPREVEDVVRTFLA